MRSLADLIGSKCRIHERAVGDVVAVLLDGECKRVIGVDVRLPDGTHRFLPWVAVELAGDGVVRSQSAFLLVDVDVGDGYVRLGARTLRDVDELSRLQAESDGTVRPLPGFVSNTPLAGTYAP